MKESEFNDLVDETLLALERAIEDTSSEIDYETTSGVLTLSFPDDSQIIINRQAPLQQIWVAAKAGGFHLDFRGDKGVWYCAATEEDLLSMVSRLGSAQLGEQLELR